MKLVNIVNYVSFALLITGLTINLANGKFISQKSHLDIFSPYDSVVEDAEDLWARRKEGKTRSSLSKTDDEMAQSNKKKQETTYVGAVVEYEPYNTWTEEEQGYGVLSENAKTVKGFANRAKTEYGADILVIPEYALTSLDVSADDLEKFLTYTLYVPEPAEKFVPCYLSDEDSDHLNALKMLSCTAIENEIYLVINVAELYPCSAETVKMAPWPILPSEDCPQEGYIFYNCEVVLDRKGTVIAKYRKQHLFMEDIFTPGQMDDKSALFLTDFNVLFTLQTCFDIAFEHPGYNNVKYMKIKDVAMSTAWVDYLPFEIADVVQSGWSRGLNANLLVAGHHKPEKGKMGSGIFKGYSGQLPVYTYNKNSGNVLLASNVTTIKATELIPMLLKSEANLFHSRKLHSSKRIIPETLLYQTKEEDRRHLAFHENLKNYTKVLLEKGTQGKIINVSACSNDDFCCDLSYQYSGNLTYMFLVFSGKFGVASGRYKLGKQVCGIVWCKTSDYNTCVHPELGFPEYDSFGPFTITSSSFKAETVFVSAFHQNFSLICSDKLLFQAKGACATTSSNEPVPDLLVSALYGRWYCEDGI